MTNVNDPKGELLTAEYQLLAETAQQQLNEHKVWLKQRLIEYQQDFMKPTKQAIDVLIHQVDEIKLESVFPEPNVRTIDDKPTLSIVYTYPDELYEFLTGDLATGEMRDSLLASGRFGLGENKTYNDAVEKPAFSLVRDSDTPGAKKP